MSIKQNLNIPKSYSVILPSVLYNKNLDDGSKILFTIIYSYCSLHGGCTANNERLCELTFSSKSVVSKRLSKLEEYDFITRKVERDIKNQVTGRTIFVRLTEEEFEMTKKSIKNEALDAFKKNIRKTPEKEEEIIGGELTSKLFTETEHKAISYLFTKWGTKGTKHKLRSVNKEQTSMAWNILYLYKLIKTDKEKYFNHLLPTLDPKWLKSNNITLDNFINSTLTFEEALEGHLSLLSDKPFYVSYCKVSNSLLDFMGNYRTDQYKRPIGKSWYLFWACKEASDKIKEDKKVIPPISKKYPNNYSFIYKKVDSIFGVNRKKLENSTVEIQNGCIELSEGIINNIILIKKQKGAQLSSLQTPNLPLYLEEFMTEQKKFIGNFIPNVFLPGRKSWNNFIDFLAKKSGDPCYYPYYDKLKQEVL